MPEQPSLVEAVRAKYPGVYNDLSDEALDQKVRAKYPGLYDDLAKPKETSTFVPHESPTGMRLKGGYTGPEEGAPEGLFSRIVRGMINPSPEMQLGMDLVPLAGAAAEAAPNALMRAAQGVKAGAGAVGRGVVAAAKNPVVDTVVGAGIGYAHSGIPGAIEGALLGTQATRAARILRALERFGQPTSEQAPTKAPSLADVVEAVQQPPAATASQTGADLPPSVRELSENARLSSSVQPTTGKSPQQALNEEAIARWRAEGKSLVEQPLPANQAGASVRLAAATDKMQLTAEEFLAATKLRAAGKPAADILDGIQAMRLLNTKGAVSTAAMRADMGQRAMSGQKSLMGEYGDESPPKTSTYRPHPEIDDPANDPAFRQYINDLVKQRETELSTRNPR